MAAMQMHRRHFLDPYPLPLQQHPLYGRALAAMGRSVGEAWLGPDAASPLGHAQWVERGLGPLRLHWLARGPIWLQDAPKDAPSQYRRDAVVKLMSRFSPLTLWLVAPDQAGDLPLAGAYRLTQPGSEHILTLSSDGDAMLAAMQGKWRNRMRRAARDGLPIHHRALDPLRDKPLLDLEISQRRQRGYRALPTAFTLAWARAAPDATRLFLAGDPSNPLAYMLFLRHGSMASYHLGWSSPAGRHACAHNLLLWTAMTHYSASQVTHLNLGPTTPANQGLDHFKTGAGAQIRRIEPTYLLTRGPSTLLPLAFRRDPV